MRGGPAFAVSLILSSLEPALRAAAELGAWQIISPVSALGRVEVVGGLHEVQEKVRILPQLKFAHMRSVVEDAWLQTQRCNVCPFAAGPTVRQSYLALKRKMEDVTLVSTLTQ